MDLGKFFGNKFLDIFPIQRCDEVAKRWEVGKFLEEKFLWKGKFCREGHDLNSK